MALYLSACGPTPPLVTADTGIMVIKPIALSLAIYLAVCFRSFNRIIIQYPLSFNWSGEKHAGLSGMPSDQNKTYIIMTYCD